LENCDDRVGEINGEVGEIVAEQNGGKGEKRHRLENVVAKQTATGTRSAAALTQTRRE
jgi:hypothetical protein